MNLEELQARMTTRADELIARHRSLPAPVEDALELYKEWGRDVADYVIETYEANGLSPTHLNVQQSVAEKEHLLAEVLAGMGKPGVPECEEARLRAALDEGFEKRLAEWAAPDG